MKATGIVRRIDDLGRIVIPKEIRRTMRIRVGDSLEIYTSKDNEVVLKKYSSMGDIEKTLNSYAEVLSKKLECPIMITDKDSVVSASGTSKNSAIGKMVTKECLAFIEERQIKIGRDLEGVTLVEGVQNPITGIYTISNMSESIGMIIAFKSKDKDKSLDEKIFLLAGELLEKQIEE